MRPERKEKIMSKSLKQSTMTPKPTRGGARKGAGRKPRTIKRKSITVRLEPQDADRLREICRAEELSQANWIANQIRISN
jgi:hypothetical protein